MLTVENDWIEYEPVARAAPVRRVAVRGGAACSTRIPVARQRPRPVAVESRASAVTSSAPAVRRPRSRLRLTRRGRFVLIVLPSLLALSAGLVAVTAPATAEAASTPSTVVIGSGDTLWSLAQRIAPGRDPRDVVAEIEAANHRTDARVRAGEVLVLPAGVTR